MEKAKQSAEFLKTRMQPEDIKAMALCDCGSGEKAVYYCQTHRNLLNPQKYRTKCHLSDTIPYYCSSQDSCLSDHGHDHRPEKIIELMDVEYKLWMSF